MSPPFARLLPFLLRYKRAFLLGLACVVTTTAIQLLSPWVLKNAIDDLNAGVTRGKLAMYAALLLAIALVGGVFRFLMRRILIGASRDIEYDMRNAFFARLQQMPLAYYQARRTGDLMSRATNDLNAVRTMIGPAVMYSANTIIVFVVAIILMASIDARLTLIALLPLPLVSVSVKYFGSAIHTRFEAIQAQLSDLSAVVQEALSGRAGRARLQPGAARDGAVSRARTRVRPPQPRPDPAAGDVLSEHDPVSRASDRCWCCGWGAAKSFAAAFRVGEFVAFNAYLVMLSWPMIAFGWVTNILQRGMASWKRMLEVLDAHARDRRSRRVATPAARAVIRGAIEIRDLTFTYPAATAPALDRVSLRIEAGQTAAFIGATGSGKSTLINLLPRLHEPPPGTIFLDGVDVREIPLATLRGAIGFVPQEPFLFSDTIAENIAFGVERSRDRAAQPPMPLTTARASRAAAAVARLDKDVATFPKGYDTLVGERGITLSGGQKQRTAIARALMVDPRLLILDDALSAVDTYTEEEILARLRGVMRQRTSLIVSHRVSTVRDADRIFVLDRGRIVEHGRHDDLVARGAALYRRRLAARESAAGEQELAARLSELRGLATTARNCSPTSSCPSTTKRCSARRTTRALMRRLLGYLRPYRLQAALALAVDHLRVGAAAGAAVPDEARDRPLHRDRRSGRPRPHRAGVPRDPARLVRARVPADLDAPDDRPAHHVRHAHADLRAPPAHRRAVLRSQSRRPPDDARHDRRRRAQRPVHGGRRLDLRRHLHARRHHDRARRHGLAAGAAGVLGAAAHRARDAVVPDATCGSPIGRCGPGSRGSTPICRSTSPAWRRCSCSAASAAATIASTTSTAATATPTSSRSSTTRCSTRRSKSSARLPPPC